MSFFFHTHPCWKISAGLELFEEGGQEESGKKQDRRPEEHIRCVGTMVTAGCPNKVPMKI